MPRQMRMDFPGAIHHVMSRGDRRENIYLDDVDRQDFLKTLAEACQKTDWQVRDDSSAQEHRGPSGVGNLQGSEQKVARL